MDIKKIAAGAVKYRNELSYLLGSLNHQDIEKGLLIIKDSLLSSDYKDIIISNSKGLLEDFAIQFQEGSINLQLSVNAKQLGPVEIDYQLFIKEFRFDATGHKLYATFKESSISTGNIAQKLAFKAALVNGPLIKTLIQFTNISYIYIDGSNLLIDFDKMFSAGKIPDNLSLNFLSSKDSMLTLSFNI